MQHIIALMFPLCARCGHLWNCSIACNALSAPSTCAGTCATSAFAAGATGALTEHPVEGGSSVVVADTLRGLEALGMAARDRTPARRGAVTGSVGKTSVTQAIKAGLDLAGPSHASIKSYKC